MFNNTLGLFSVTLWKPSLLKVSFILFYFLILLNKKFCCYKNEVTLVQILCISCSGDLSFFLFSHSQSLPSFSLFSFTFCFPFLFLFLILFCILLSNCSRKVLEETVSTSVGSPEQGQRDGLAMKRLTSFQRT